MRHERNTTADEGQRAYPFGPASVDLLERAVLLNRELAIERRAKIALGLSPTRRYPRSSHERLALRLETDATRQFAVGPADELQLTLRLGDWMALLSYARLGMGKNRGPGAKARARYDQLMEQAIISRGKRHRKKLIAKRMSMPKEERKPLTGANSVDEEAVEEMRKEARAFGFKWSFETALGKLQRRLKPRR